MVKIVLIFPRVRDRSFFLVYLYAHNNHGVHRVIIAAARVF